MTGQDFRDDLLRMNPRFFNLLMAFAFACAAVARGWNLWRRSLLEHDEGHALLNANTWWHMMRWGLSGGWTRGSESLAEVRDTLHQQGGTLYSAGKLGYSLIVAATALPMQVSTDLALALGWAVGLGVAGLAGALAWQYSRSRMGAMIAVGGCLASPLMTTLSREASGTIWALALGMAGLWLMQRGLQPCFQAKPRPWWNRKQGIAGGVLLAYGFTCHFNLAPFILGVFVATGFYGLSRDREVCPQGATEDAPGSAAGRDNAVRRFLGHVIPGAAGALGMLLLFELGTRVVDVMLSRAYPDFLPLSGELHRLFFRDQVPMLDGVLYGDGAIGWGWDAWAIYGAAALREGPSWLLLLLVVLPVALLRGRHRRARLAPAVALLLIPLLFWLAYVYRVERVMGMCVTASWIVLGVALGPGLDSWWLPQTGQTLKAGRWKAAAWLLALAHLAAGGAAWISLARAESPLPGVVARTFDAPRAQGKLITASAFDGGFAPLWKWAIVEEARKRDKTAGAPRIDFSTFDRPEVMFIDPFSWRRFDEDFHITRQEAAAGEVIAEGTSRVPPWHLQAVLLLPAAVHD